MQGRRSNPFSRYLTRHGHYPRFRYKVGKRGDVLAVEISNNYVHLRLISKHRVEQEIYIPRRVWWRLLKGLVKATKLMSGDFYPPDAMREYLKREEQFAHSQRQLKKALYGSRSRSRRRRSDR